MTPALWAVLTAASLTLVALFVMDLRQQRLPDALNLLLLLGLGFRGLQGFVAVPAVSAFAGALAGAGLLWGLRWIYLRRRGSEALGLGDVKYAAAAGVWVGIDGIFLVIALGAALTLAAVLGWRVLRGGVAAAPLPGARPLPFGPGLILATVAVFITLVWQGGWG